MTHLHLPNEPTAACGATTTAGLTLQARSLRAPYDYDRQLAQLTCKRCRSIFRAINT